MLSFIIRRLLVIFPMVLLVITLTWVLIRLAPGNFYATAKGLPPAVEKNIRAKYGLDKPWYVQYGKTMWAILGGDFGFSRQYPEQTVNEILGRSLPVSATIGITAYLIALFFGLVFGTLAALRQNSALDYSSMAAAMLGISIPNFVLGPLLVLIFSLTLFWLPPARWQWVVQAGPYPALYYYLSRIIIGIIGLLVIALLIYGIYKAVTGLRVGKSSPKAYAMNTISFVLGMLLAAVVMAATIGLYILALPVGKWAVIPLTILVLAIIVFAAIFHRTLSTIPDKVGLPSVAFVAGFVLQLLAPFIALLIKMVAGLFKLVGQIGPVGIPHWRYLLLPALTLSAIYMAYIARLTRAGMLEVLRKDYVRTARAKGLSERAVIMQHALRGGILPVVSYTGPALAFLVGGTVIVERIYALPGLGNYLINAALNRDEPLLLGITAFISILILLFNLLVDIAYAYIDPRIRFS